MRRLRGAGRRQRLHGKDVRLHNRANRRRNVRLHPLAHAARGTAGRVSGRGAVPDARNDEQLTVRELRRHLARALERRAHVSGGLDMRTPLKGAREVTAQFPHGQLLVVPSVGHSTTTADATGCAARGVRQWMQTNVAPTICPVVKPYVLPVQTLPAPGAAKPAHPASARATYAVAAAAVHDAQEIWLLTGAFGGTERTAGLYGGQVVASAKTIKLVNYALARGITVNGTL